MNDLNLHFQQKKLAAKTLPNKAFVRAWDADADVDAMLQSVPNQADVCFDYPASAAHKETFSVTYATDASLAPSAGLSLSCELAGPVSIHLTQSKWRLLLPLLLALAGSPAPDDGTGASVMSSELSDSSHAGPSSFSVLLHGLHQHSGGEEVEEAMARRLEQSPLRFASAFSNWSVLGSIRASDSVRVAARLAALVVHLDAGQMLRVGSTQASLAMSSVGRLSWSLLCEEGVASEPSLISIPGPFSFNGESAGSTWFIHLVWLFGSNMPLH